MSARRSATEFTSLDPSVRHCSNLPRAALACMSVNCPGRRGSSAVINFHHRSFSTPGWDCPRAVSRGFVRDFLISGSFLASPDIGGRRGGRDTDPEKRRSGETNVGETERLAEKRRRGGTLVLL